MYRTTCTNAELTPVKAYQEITISLVKCDPDILHSVISEWTSIDDEDSAEIIDTIQEDIYRFSIGFVDRTYTERISEHYKKYKPEKCYKNKKWHDRFKRR